KPSPPSAWPSVPATPRSSRIAPAKPRTASSPISPSAPTPDRSRPVRCRVRTGSPSTTSCCASRKIWVRWRATPAAAPFTSSGDPQRHPTLRTVAIILALLILALQYPMWFGKGGWLQLRELNAQVAAQRRTNAELKARNQALDAEVRDLKQGYEAIEERARSDLGMIRQDEIFFQLPAEAASSAALSQRER